MRNFYNVKSTKHIFLLLGLRALCPDKGSWPKYKGQNNAYAYTYTFMFIVHFKARTNLKVVSQRENHSESFQEPFTLYILYTIYN